MKKWIVFLSLIALCCAGCSGGISEPIQDTVRLLCLNIGKADCMVLTYQEYAYVIDTGYEQTWPALEAALRQFGISRLDGVFLTHCHQDHMGGLMPLANSNIEISAWYAAQIYYDQKEETHPLKLAAESRNQEPVWLEAGSVISVGESASFTVLGPLTENTDNENNNSLVMRFSCPEGSILLVGDMKEDEEYELLDAGVIEPVDLLKAGHHGDNRATTAALLNAAKPKAAIILTSSAEESDTPDASTLTRLEKAGCAVYVSQDFHDAALFSLNSHQITVEDIRWDGVPDKQTDLEIKIDLSHDTLTILNRGNVSVQLQDYAVYSTRGNELTHLPSAALEPGQQYVIGSKTTDLDVDYLWEDKKIWHQKKSDMAILYDAYGRPVAVTDNGIME